MYKEISVTEAAKLLENGKAIMLDVREQDEFDAEHIPGVSLMPLSNFPGLFAEFDLPKNKELIIQCRSGGRSQKVCEFIAENNNCYNLIGGIIAWKKAGFSVITKT